MFTPIETSYSDPVSRARRLDSVLCLYDGKIKSISTKEHSSWSPLSLNQVYLVPFGPYTFDIPSNDPERLRIDYVNNEKLNVFDINLGYFDTPMGAICVGRLPFRSTSIGITQSNITDVSGKIRRAEVSRFFYKSWFVDMLLDKYAAPDVTWNMVRAGATSSKAVNKDYALSCLEPGLFALSRRGTVLGISTSLDPNFSILSPRKKLSALYVDEVENLGFTLT